MAKTTRAVMVGCGGMSAAWLGPISEMKDVEIVGLVDVLKKNASARAKQFDLGHATVGTDLKTILRATDPEVVFDCTIPEAHTAVTTTALRHGCHVLGEKPMAASMAEARRSIRAAEKANRIYAVIQNRRYLPQMRRIQRALASGRIGDVTTINCDFFLGPHFGGFRDHMPHVLLLDMAIHTFDQSRMLSGTDPVSVYCREWNPKGSWYDHDASAVAIFDMTSKIVFTYRGSWCAQGRDTAWDATWRIIGSRGTLTWNGADEIRIGRVRKTGGLIHEPVDIPVPPMRKRDRVGGHAGLIREFLDCVKKGGTPETACTDNIKSLAMVFAAIKSAQRDRRVDVTW